MDKQRNSNGHLVLVPCPFQGHMKPMLHLAKLLHYKGFFITIINTQPNSSISTHHPEFSFVSIDGSLDCHDGDVVPYLFALNTKCTAPFRDCLARMVSSDNSNEPILCIIYDAVMYFSVAVADDLEIPRIVLRTSSAANFYALSLFKQKGCNPIQDNQLEEPLEEFPILRMKDMPVFETSYQEAREQVFTSIHKGTKTASAIIWNTLDCLEQTIMEKIKEMFLVTMFPIGPLQKYMNASLSSLLTEDQSCIVWLDTQSPSSVIYLSTGSLITISETDLIEMAWGLANSGQPFLWVVRPGLVNGSNGIELLPKEFKEITRMRGMVVNWAPQQEVLAHQSIGVFWTHNGWNSTIESISEGVPMLCWPRVGDQRVIARFVSHFWKVGIQLEEKLDRVQIEKTIRRLMVDKEGEKIKERAMELKEKVGYSLRQGGSSCEFFGKLINYIKLL